jgi:D-alanyl-D-alanine carboxypeptidase/D-alanyl-D-alanine-endopeptidase (penicillin-binding protein 4)
LTLMRRWMVPLLLALVLAVSSGLAANAAMAASRPELDAGGSGSGISTPVLSPRRVPDLLSHTVSEIRLGEALDAALDAPALASAHDSTCLTVEDAGTVLYRRQPDARLIPASTMKVLTGTAALRRLGDGFRFVTEVRTEHPPDGAGVVDGPLFLVGSGDPLLETQAYADSFRNQPQVFTSLDKLADDIVAAGVHEIRGGILGDESRYDTERYLSSWKPGYITDNEIGPVSALAVNDNFAQFRPKKTIATPLPPVHGATVLTDLLRGRGVIVADPGAGTAPETARTIAIASSPALPDVVGEMLRESDNMTAEMLTKELGKRFGGAGSWAEGVRVIRDTVASAGLPAQDYAAVDGSGLDVSDRVSCALLMDALDLAGPKSAITSGFAIAGQSGTLAERFKGTPAEGRLRAKTGTLNNVVGLVGFVDAAQDRTLEFALLANALPDKTASGRALQDAVASALVRYPDAPAAAEIAPQAPQPPPEKPAGG